MKKHILAFMGLAAMMEACQPVNGKQNAEITNNEVHKITNPYGPEGGYKHTQLVYGNSRPPKEYGMYLQRTGRQKWTKKKHK